MLKKILLLSLIALVAIPAIGLAIDFGRPPEVQDQPNADSANFVLNFLGSILDILWIIFIAFAIIMFIVAGFQFLAAHGEVEGYGKAQKAVLWGVIGVIIGVLAFTIPFFIRNTLFPATSVCPPGMAMNATGQCVVIPPGDDQNATGACCTRTGPGPANVTCRVITRDACNAGDNEFVENSTCNPIPC